MGCKRIILYIQDVTHIVMQVSVGLLSAGCTPALSPTECEGNP